MVSNNCLTTGCSGRSAAPPPLNRRVRSQRRTLTMFRTSIVSDIQSKNIVRGVVATVVLLLCWRVYSHWPTTIKGTGPVSQLKLRPDSVSVALKEDTTASEIANMRVFERFSFDTSAYEAEESLGDPDKWGKEGDATFNEYIRPMGRLRFYEAPRYGEQGGIEDVTNWVEAVPNQLFADQFFDKAIAKHLDLSKKTQKVYIPVPSQRCYMSVTLDSSRVSRIAWLPHDY